MRRSFFRVDCGLCFRSVPLPPTAYVPSTAPYTRPLLASSRCFPPSPRWRLLSFLFLLRVLRILDPLSLLRPTIPHLAACAATPLTLSLLPVALARRLPPESVKTPRPLPLPGRRTRRARTRKTTARREETDANTQKNRAPSTSGPHRSVCMSVPTSSRRERRPGGCPRAVSGDAAFCHENRFPKKGTEMDEPTTLKCQARVLCRAVRGSEMILPAPHPASCAA